MLLSAYQVLLTLPIMSAGVKRAFPKLSLVKSKLRTAMRQERLESLMLCTNRDTIHNASKHHVSQFAAAGDCRPVLVLTKLVIAHVTLTGVVICEKTVLIIKQSALQTV